MENIEVRGVDLKFLFIVNELLLECMCFEIVFFYWKWYLVLVVGLWVCISVVILFICIVIVIFLINSFCRWLINMFDVLYKKKYLKD